MSTKRDQLEKRLAELRETPAYPWAPIAAWIARTKPLFESALREFRAGFDEAIKEPRWATPMYFATTSRSGVRTDNFQQANDSAEVSNRRIAEEKKLSLESYLVGVLDALALVGEVNPGLGVLGGSSAGAGANQTIVYGTMVSNSPGAAVATHGSHAAVIAPTDSMTQEQHAGLVADLRKRLIDLESQIEEVDAKLVDGLYDSLRRISKLEISGKEGAQLIETMKVTLDECWVESMLPKLRANPGVFDILKGTFEASKHPLLVKAAILALGGGTTG